MRILRQALVLAGLLVGCSDKQAAISHDPQTARSNFVARLPSGWTPPSPDMVNGTGVVDHLSYSILDGLPHVDVWPVKATPMAAVADLKLFGDFRPGLTFEEAAKRHGEPATIRKLSNLTELRCYPRGAVTLAVGREPLGSFHPTVREKWTVWAFPHDAAIKLSTLVNQQVLEQVQVPTSPYRLVLRESTQLEGSLWLKVISGEVTEARWINSESVKKQKQ